MKNKFWVFSLLLLFYSVSFAQFVNTEHNVNRFLKKLDASVTLGSTGIGVELSSPINNCLKLRAGFDIMPEFESDLKFLIQVGADGEYSDERFQRLSEMLEGFTGYKVDNKVYATGKPTFHNAKVLLDIFPFKNKKFHFTAGLYYGSSNVAEAVNKMEEMSSLLAVGMYNTMYDKAENDEPIIVIGDIAIYRPDLVDYGRMGVFLGTRNSDDKPYIMEPDKNSMVSAKMKVNKFRPYLGFGYGSTLMNSNDKYKISFDCGIMFWGGTPKLIAHDGVDLVRDIRNIPKGNVRKYVNIVKKMDCYPVINLKISRRLF
jgi:hypothetical protein